MPTPIPGTVQYRPALLPGGGVSLSRAVLFSQLVQKVAEEKLNADRERLVDEIDAEIRARAEAPAREPQTFDELVGGVSSDATAAPRQLPRMTGFEVFEGCINGDWATRFAAVCVEAVEPGGSVRQVTEAEAASESFPVAPFSAALLSFWEASAPLLGGLMNTPVGTASISETEAT